MLLRSRLVLYLLLLLSGCLHASTVPVYDYEIVARYPHSTAAFTQGFLFHDGHLYESTGLYGRSSLNRIDLESGEVLLRHSLPQHYFAEGIAVVDDRLFQLTWRENLVFEYDLETFRILDTHYHPGEGWGLAWDGRQLILSDGSAELQFIDPNNFSVQRRIEVLADGMPVSNLNELQYINGEVWANVWMRDEIMRIDPQSGHVTGIVDLDGLVEQTRLGGRPGEAVLNGIAWDAAGERLLVTGKLWADIFQIELLPRESVADE